MSDKPPVSLGYFSARDLPARWGVHRGAAYVLLALGLAAAAGWAIDRLKPDPGLTPEERERVRLLME